MKQIVVLSGKGGTGKTTITAAFAHLANQNKDSHAILVDADVDAANLELLLHPTQVEAHEFIGGEVAVIHKGQCIGCGRCMEVCRFDAIAFQNDSFQVIESACEGCAACETQCPEKAITMIPQVSGKWFTSHSLYGPLYHAQLAPAQENSGKLVTLLRQNAHTQAQQEDKPLIIVDGPPGIGCPVIAAMTGTDLVVAVTEPTAAGIHDLKRVLGLAAHFGIRALVCINKADLYPAGTDQILDYCQQEGLEVLGHLPFDLTIADAMVQGQTITRFRPDAPTSQALAEMWRRLAHITLPTS